MVGLDLRQRVVRGVRTVALRRDRVRRLVQLADRIRRRAAQLDHLPLQLFNPRLCHRRSLGGRRLAHGGDVQRLVLPAAPALLNLRPQCGDGDVQRGDLLGLVRRALPLRVQVDRVVLGRRGRRARLGLPALRAELLLQLLVRRDELVALATLLAQARR